MWPKSLVVAVFPTPPSPIGAAAQYIPTACIFSIAAQRSARGVMASRLSTPSRSIYFRGTD